MKTILTLILTTMFLFSLCWAADNKSITLGDLQGAWWSSAKEPTADFAIIGDEVWLDSETDLQPCEMRGKDLVFILDGGDRIVEIEILSLEGDTLVVRYKHSQQVATLKREK